MKVYFTGSLHNEGIKLPTYRVIVERMEKMGHKVSNTVLKTTSEQLDTLKPDERAKYYQKLKRMISRVEVVVAEVSYPSTINIGHEVSLALDMGKPLVALYQPGREPGVLQGVDSERFILLEYTVQDLDNVLSYAMEEAQAQMDVRFNFFISPKIGNYLDEISKKRRIPRAVYLRRLIEEDMKKNKEWLRTNNV